MGLRSSKHNRNSYDIAPVVSNKDFSYKKHNRPLPKVELPAEAKKSDEHKESNGSSSQEVQATLVVAENADKTNEQDPRIPEWVNEDNFKKLLLKTHNNITDITSFKAYPAMAAGENYATLMLRIKITAKLDNGTSKDFSFMLKVPHQTKEMKEMLKAMNFFITENTVYSDVLPELEEMYRQAGVEVSFGPKSYKLDIEDPNIHYVLLDDLSVSGFKNANRLECLNMEHTLGVLRKMAQFHAATACRVAKKGAYSAVFSPDMDNEMARAMMTQMFMAFKKPFLNNLKNYENGEKYYDLMDHFFDNLIELFLRSRKLLPGYFSVLNHGDSWSNNILFKYSDEGKVEETLYVDFQNSNWGSPALDLYYFIISSVQIDIKLSQFDYFIRYYHEHLSHNLKLLQYPLEYPNLREFHMQLLDFGSMATMTSFFTLGVVLLDPTEAAKFENFLGDNEDSVNFKNAMYSNERYVKYINQILPWLYNRGFMEINLTDLDNKIAAADKLKNETIVTTQNQTKDSEQENLEQSSVTYPEWVNEKLFIDIVRADCENYQKIVKFTVSPATVAGDNYSSIILKVDIDIELTDLTTHNLSYMLKIPPTGEKSKVLIDLLNAFEKETTGYNEIIPQFENIYKQQANVEINFAPKVYSLKEKPQNDILLLENLTVKGFKNCDRLEGLDKKHTEAVLKKLAEFHAASAYIFETKGKFPSVFERSIYEKNVEFIDKDSLEKMFLECLKEYEGHEEYIDNVINYMKNSEKCLKELSTVNWNKFNVLNHGDCWTNNIMFQHDESGNIINTLFVDFQLMMYGSPCYDLYYFLMSSPKLDLKLEHFDYFIRYYHDHLKANLELLKYPKEIPSLKDLHLEMMDNSAWALNTVVRILSAVLLDPSDKPSLEKIIGDNDDSTVLRKQMYLNKRYRSHVELIYPWLLRRGLLEFNKMSDSINNSCDNTKQKLPSWIQPNLFVDVLKELHNDFVEILEFKVGNALAPGENYATVMLKVEIVIKLKDNKTKSVSLMLKIGHDSEVFNDFMKNHNVFAIEAGMYRDFVPEFEKIYADVGVEVKFGAKSYQLPTEHQYILLENLKLKGFKNINRLEGLDMEHTKSVLKKLAQWHAASAVRVEKKGPYPRDYCTGYLKPESYEMIKGMFDGMTKTLLECVKEYSNSELYYDKVAKLHQQITDEIYKYIEVDPTEFNVLNHGDCWSNNIMFRYDDSGKLVETYLVDYQMPRYTTPVSDILYLLLSSTKLEIKLKHFDYFIKFYHDCLVENLQILKYNKKIPSLKELHCMVYKYGVFGYMITTNIMAAVLCDPSDDANLDNFVNDSEDGIKFKKQMYSNERYRKHAEAVFPWLLYKGMLDC